MLAAHQVALWAVRVGELDALDDPDGPRVRPPVFLGWAAPRYPIPPLIREMVPPIAGPVGVATEPGPESGEPSAANSDSPTAASATEASSRPRPVLDAKRVAALRKLREKIDPKHLVVGHSPVILEVFEKVHHANKRKDNAAVLVLGEPGTGKTHIARLIHDSSGRASKAFVSVNAAGGGGDLNIQRGEWIGYGKDHAIQGVPREGREGHIGQAKDGTIFVDEFAGLSHDLQVTFLQVLEERSILKVGGDAVVPNVRCIFATNANVDEAVAQETLRRDLLDRIAVRIVLPPLRERRGDILPLVRHFADKHRVANSCLLAILRHDWPGNVRGSKLAIDAALAWKAMEGTATVELAHIASEIPIEVIRAVEALDDNECQRELWSLADEIARDEGFKHRAGLQKRAGEIMGVGETQASKMYDRFGLASLS